MAWTLSGCLALADTAYAPAWHRVFGTRATPGDREGDSFLAKPEGIRERVIEIIGHLHRSLPKAGYALLRGKWFEIVARSFRFTCSVSVWLIARVGVDLLKKIGGQLLPEFRGQRQQAFGELLNLCHGLCPVEQPFISNQSNGLGRLEPLHVDLLGCAAYLRKIVVHLLPQPALHAPAERF